jgi:cysteine desulfurase/selenocysteine lyase
MLAETLRRELPFLQDRLDLSVANPGNRRKISLDSTATTSPTREALEALLRASFDYAPFERGGSDAGIKTSLAVLSAYNFLANLVGANSWKEMVLGRNTTEMLNHVVNALKRGYEGFPRFQSGQNIVTTYLEHNSNYLPWLELTNFLKEYGINVDLRLVNVDRKTGQLDMKDLQSKVDAKTRVVSVTGKSNVLATVPDLYEIGRIAHRQGALYVIDGAQYVPNNFVDVKGLDVDLLAFSLHKMMAPFGVGVLYGKSRILEAMPAFIVGGGTVDDVGRAGVKYYGLPQKFMAGSPDSLGIIASHTSVQTLLQAALGNLEAGKEASKAFTAMALNAPSGEWDYRYQVSAEEGALIRAEAQRLGNSLVISDSQYRREYARKLVQQAMQEIASHEIDLTQRALDGLSRVPGIEIYGSLPAEQRYGLVSFNLQGKESRQVGFELNKRGIEIRPDKHCAHLLHHHILNVNGTVRASFGPYNTREEVDALVTAVREM